MIILDTNVISELMRDSPAHNVLTWLDAQLNSTLFVTAVTEAEIRTGIAIMPAGERRNRLVAAAGLAFDGLFANRIWPFDSNAARGYAAIVAGRRNAGRPISQFDCQIASIARSRGAAVATRNVTDFDDAGIEVINPWSSV